jgi:hypothetical protein
MSILRTIGGWVRKLTTSRDNQTPDVIRITAILISAQFLGLAAYDALTLENGFDPANYGAGAAAILAATGAALWAKRNDEPENLA